MIIPVHRGRGSSPFGGPFAKPTLNNVATLESRVLIAQEARTLGWKKLWVVLGVLFGLLLIIFYLGMCLYRKDMTIVDDLRKLSNKKRKMRMELLKAKNY